jgi:hypothetical protein
MERSATHGRADGRRPKQRRESERYRCPTGRAVPAASCCHAVGRRSGPRARRALRAAGGPGAADWEEVRVWSDGEGKRRAAPSGRVGVGGS